jgi:AcrR family transcriptional regulator
LIESRIGAGRASIKQLIDPIPSPIPSPIRGGPIPAVDRREQISLAAYAGIAEHGFEGLRMRDVAARAGVNIATVHYYYATKEELIGAAYQVMQHRFQASLPAGGSPADRLAGHLNGILELLINDADLRQVLAEVALRAGRDRGLGERIGAVEDDWFEMVRQLVQEGVDEGSWAVEVDPAAFAVTVVAMLKGICMPTLVTSRQPELRAAIRQQLTWLTGR